MSIDQRLKKAANNARRRNKSRNGGKINTANLIYFDI